jgi:4-hydroxybenzoate polyprenyltransferase
MIFNKITQFLSLVKFSHTIFALPFAAIGFALGVQDSSAPSLVLAIKILLCMLFARNAAMAFNRFVDRFIDAKNPRTLVREIPAGIIKAQSVLWFYNF